ncbi:MAG TPA: GNAT family protein [Ohtaekwangia sp.]|uniref:GNAT family N-acetyltransferase n=1 Tax=Ohtaekwangia sp. TaxID=2066019 RepID=UPI002F92F5D6
MIRAADKKDFTFIYSLYMHPEINPYLLYEVMDATAFQPEFDALLARDILYVYEGDDGQAAGMFKFIPYTHRSDHVAYVGGLAIAPDRQGKGYGLRMMREIIELGNALHILRIELSTAVNNEKAIGLYERAGFQKEGVLRKYTHLKKENIFLDEVLMAYIYP